MISEKGINSRKGEVESRGTRGGGGDYDRVRVGGLGLCRSWD